MRLIYTIWCVFWFALIFLLVFPFTYISLQQKAWKPYTNQLNRFWGRTFLIMAGMPLDIEWRFRPDPNATYVFCANHFSLLDIVVLNVVVPNYIAFIGKDSISKVPLFGYMYSRLHILVNRQEAKSRVGSLARSMRTVAEGRSIAIFPEGGIVTQNPPTMQYPLMDGALKIAHHAKVPIVPVSLLTNHLIVPDKAPLRVSWNRVKVIVHKPFETANIDKDAIPELKERLYHLLNNELKPYQVN
jgi:1-acyl-sn-glycerol-3-phosphate acyltransferase